MDNQRPQQLEQQIQYLQRQQVALQTQRILEKDPQQQLILTQQHQALTQQIQTLQQEQQALQAQVQQQPAAPAQGPYQQSPGYSVPETSQLSRPQPITVPPAQGQYQPQPAQQPPAPQPYQPPTQPEPAQQTYLPPTVAPFPTQQTQPAQQQPTQPATSPALQQIISPLSSIQPPTTRRRPQNLDEVVETYAPNFYKYLRSETSRINLPLQFTKLTDRIAIDDQCTVQQDIALGVKIGADPRSEIIGAIILRAVEGYPDGLYLVEYIGKLLSGEFVYLRHETWQDEQGQFQSERTDMFTGFPPFK